jgi:hypothetical protein
MVVMLVFGCGFGWFAYKIKRAREQREVVKGLRNWEATLMSGPPPVAWHGPQ